MPVKCAVNGFGRIGRLSFRFAWDMPELEIVHINEITGGAETAAYLVQYDSVHGTWGHSATCTSPTSISIDGKSVTFSDKADFTQVDWKAMGVELVLDCTGKFLKVKDLQPYLDVCGVKRVVVSAPVKEPSVLNVVVGCNDHLLDDKHVICTAASCTTNCIAPIIKVIHEQLTIEKGMITTVHNITGTQSLVDMVNDKKSDLRRARSGMLNLAPTSTGSATAVAEVFPELKGKLNGHAIRVPMLNSSITDMVFIVGRDTTVDEVNAMLKQASEPGSDLAETPGAHARSLRPRARPRAPPRLGGSHRTPTAGWPRRRDAALLPRDRRCPVRTQSTAPSWATRRNRSCRPTTSTTLDPRSSTRCGRNATASCCVPPAPRRSPAACRPLRANCAM